MEKENLTADSTFQTPAFQMIPNSTKLLFLFSEISEKRERKRGEKAAGEL